MYQYYADVTAVHDADTYVVDISAGYRIWLKAQHMRLAGFSCRELSMPGGPEARAYAASLLPVGSRVVIASIKLEHDPADVMSFERYVVNVQLPDGRDLGHTLEEAGFAIPWDGRSRPVPYPPWPIPVEVT